MLEDVTYYLEPTDIEDSSLTSPHYVIVADSLRPSNTSCGIQFWSRFLADRTDAQYDRLSVCLWRLALWHSGSIRGLKVVSSCS